MLINILENTPDKAVVELIGELDTVAVENLKKEIERT